ncbi:tetratricopeptide repeat protein [Ectobacillus sp. sgz5001026]|uniref:tetratricopeptide repeat protein n=1 Tax=Ectobacillus sp. sgz5001026 TaxID=3242473 RepID=UPI0036D332F5
MIWIVLYVIYCFLVTKLFLFLNKGIMKEKEGILDYGWLLSLVFPIIGLLASLILLLLRPKQMNSSWLHEYSDYISFHVQNYEDIYVAAKQDMDLTSFSTGMQLEHADIQKQLIVQVGASPVSKEGNLLKAALLQKDPETVHYAATTINILHDRYRKQIDYLQGQFNQDTSQQDVAFQLASLYLRYLESELLSPRQIAELLDECTPIFDRFMDLFENVPTFMYVYGKLLMISGKYYEAEEQFFHTMDMHPEESYGYIGLLEIYYDQKSWTKLFHIIETLTKRNMINNLPYQYQLFAEQIGGTILEQEH